ncbi:MAG: 2Fe-2S iron-sulfur cluster-binding protein, partial [Proteobacteria bacterium]|nr:2Fe-2S iron-sulfur cluster-binding protein [Pseudomonadota bacterium]
AQTPPPPKNPGMVTLSVDGKEVVVKPGTSLIVATQKAGAEVPHYCYHPRLSLSANCRMCMVETSNAPKLVPACQATVAEGQVVKTDTPKVKAQQRAVLEFLLLNHPVDCPICDQAGECKLQDYYVRYHHQPSRLRGPKVQKNKRKVLGPTVLIDQERCILCTRCVRFMKEVAKEPQLGIFGRGSHERVDVFPGAKLDSNYSGNLVELCPVGALLNRDFRFKARAWFLSTAPSICTACSRGCNVFADYMNQDCFRFRPRENETINQSWLCDVGRKSYRWVDENRALLPMSSGKPASVDEALNKAASLLQKAQGSIGVLASPTASNEDLMAALAFARDVLKVNTVFTSGRPDGTADSLLMLADKNPNRKGLEYVAKALGVETKPFNTFSPSAFQAVWVLGGEMPESDIVMAARLKTVPTIVQAQHSSEWANECHVLLPVTSHLETECSMTQHEGTLQRCRQAFAPKGDCAPHWLWVIRLANLLGAKMGWSSAKDVFSTIAPRIPEFANFDWEGQAAPKQCRPGLPLPAASDGRPPAYRQFACSSAKGFLP